MIISEHEINGYSYVSVKFNQKEDSEILNKIIIKAKEDAKKVNKKSPNGEKRTDELINYNNLGGVLAEEIVKIYLRKIADEKGIKISIYSPPFTGHTEHRDIKIELENKEKTVEVRSSFQYLQPDLAKVIERVFSLIGPYTTSYKRNEPEKDFYIQVIHRYRNPEIVNRIADEIEAIILGGGSKKLFEEIGEKTFLKQEGAEYLAIKPPKKTKGVRHLVSEILEIK